MVAFALLTAWLLATAFVRPLSVDESQYVAATSLVAGGSLPYRDFAYLQTPLQPFVFAPLQWLFTGHLYLACRIANAMLASAVVFLVYAAGRRAGASERAAVAASAMLVTCESFIWCAGVARNDMLPAVLMTAGLLVLVRARNGWGMFAGGVALGLAASAKISYAVPGAAILVAELLTRAPDRRWRFLCFGAGLVVGALPALLVAALAPRAAFTEAILYPARAPALYYTEIGKQWRLGAGRFWQLLVAAAVGPALIAGVEVARRLLAQPRRWWDDPARRMLLAAALGGLLSAGMNRPFQIFYLLPALPPLFMLLALILGETIDRPRWLLCLWALFIVIGLSPVLAWFGRAAVQGASPVLEAEQTSRDIGAVLRARHVEGPVAGLVPQYIPDSGFFVDRRFAAGPFLYRTRNFLSPKDAAAWHIVTREPVNAMREPLPMALVTSSNPEDSPDMEAQLEAFAMARAYRAVAPFRGFTVWVRGYSAASAPPMTRTPSNANAARFRTDRLHASYAGRSR